MKKLAFLLAFPFLSAPSLYALDLLQSSSSWSDKVKCEVSNNELTYSGNWGNGKAVYTFQDPLDLSGVGSSVSVTYSFTRPENQNNILATVTLFGNNNALITGWGQLSNSTGIQAGVKTDTSSANGCFRLGTPQENESWTGKTYTEPLSGINLTNPFVNNQATVTLTLTCTATSEWQLTMSFNSQTQTIILGGNQTGSEAYNCDFSQITNLTVSMESPNNTSMKFTTLTVNYSAPEPSCPVLIAITSLLAFRRKPKR